MFQLNFKKVHARIPAIKVKIQYETFKMVVWDYQLVVVYFQHINIFLSTPNSSNFVDEFSK